MTTGSRTREGLTPRRWTVRLRTGAAVLLLCAPFALPAHAADQPIAKIEASPKGATPGKLPGKLRDKIERNLEIVDGKARSRAQAKRRIERTAQAVRAVLESEGYYDADIQGRIDEAGDKDDPGRTPPLQPVLVVDPGPRYGIGTADVEFVGGIYDQADAARAELKLDPGDPAVAVEVVAAGLRVTNWLEQHGYPDAAIPDREVELDHGADVLNVDYPVVAGPKVIMGDLILYKGDAKVSQRFLDWIQPYEPGDVFDERKLDRLTSRVVSTGVFEQAVATLSDRDQPNPDGTVTRNVLLNIEQGKRNTVAGSVGFSTTEGSGVEAIYERRNFVGYAQTLTIRATARTNEIGLGATYFVPYLFDVDRSLTGEIRAERIDTDEFEGERVLGNLLASERMTDHFRIGYGLGLEASRFTQNGLEQTAYVVDAVGTASLDYRNNRLDPTKGYVATAEVRPSYNFGDNSAFFTRAEVTGAAYQRVAPEFVLAGRLGAGSIFGTELENVPVNRRFYAGGGGSVRGFEYQSIGPRNTLDLPTGGRSVVFGSGEVRWRSRTLFDGNIGAAAFVDAATVAVPELADFQDIRYGAGVGIRYFTRFAPMRADIAIPLNPREGDDAFQVYISIGQAF